MTDVTLAAPYGYKADGTPKKKTGRPPGSRTRRIGAGATTGGTSPYRRPAPAEPEPERLIRPERPAPEAGAEAFADILVDRLATEALGADPVSAIGEATDAADTTRAKTRASGLPAVTAAVRKDIAAKIAFMLKLSATMWQAADPFCGGALDEIGMPLSQALADIVVDSADLVAWFTSGGNYMKWLTLVTVTQPLAVTLWQHHVSHTIGAEDEHPAEQYDPSQYPSQPAEPRWASNLATA